MGVFRFARDALLSCHSGLRTEDDLHGNLMGRNDTIILFVVMPKYFYLKAIIVQSYISNCELYIFILYANVTQRTHRRPFFFIHRDFHWS